MAPSVPVIVGVGQVANKDPERMVHPEDLLVDALRAAGADAEVDVRSLVDGLWLTQPDMGGDPDALFRRLADRAELSVGVHHNMRWSGTGPQEGLNEACDQLAAGRVGAVALVTGVADASVRRAREKGIEPLGPSTGLEGQANLDPDAVAPARQGPPLETAAGVRAVGTSFALAESVLAAEAGRSFSEQRQWLGEVMAPFTDMAARRPEIAWFPISRPPEAISTVSADNRLINEPYTKRMNAFPTVDLAAALILTTTDAARRFGIPEDRWVFPWAGAACHEAYPPSERPDLARPASVRAAASRALAAAGLDQGDVTRFDLYSCFPAAVQMEAESLGISPRDPRGVTATGGLPFFGGPGAGYVTHAITCLVEECRRDPSTIGALVAVGGMIAHFAAGIYSAQEPNGPWRSEQCAEVESQIQRQRVSVDLSREGVAEVEAMTVAHNRGEVVNAPVIVRFPDGVRSGARPPSRALAAGLSGVNLVGQKVRIRRQDAFPVYEVV